MYYNNKGCGPWDHCGHVSIDAPLNIEENETEYTVNMYAPSLKKEKISVTTSKDILFIRYRGEPENNARYTTREYHVHGLERKIDLKGKVDIEKIKAIYSDGILKIELPKTMQAKMPPKDVPVA